VLAPNDEEMVMDHKVERVKTKAHEIWEREGRPAGRHDEHWRQAEAELEAEAEAEADGDGEKSGNGSGPNEGEGSQTGAADYNRGARRFAASGQVEPKAREAADAVSGAEGKALRQAEKAGKSRSRGEDPDVKR
jgi:hypothetical protein